MKKNSLPSIHAVALSICNCGVLIRGASRIGKTDLALELVKNGHKLIADDAVMLDIRNSKINLICDKANRQFIYLRDIGFVNLDDLYGKKSSLNKKRLKLIIDLVKQSTHQLDIEFEQLELTPKLSIPKFTFNYNSTRPNALIVELIVRLFKSKNNLHRFIRKHQKLLNKGA